MTELFLLQRREYAAAAVTDVLFLSVSVPSQVLIEIVISCEGKPWLHTANVSKLISNFILWTRWYFSDTSTYLLRFFTEHSLRKLKTFFNNSKSLKQFCDVMDEENEKSAQNSDDTDYETDEEALGNHFRHYNITSYF